MIFHDIHLSQICRGDHLYVRERFLRTVRSEGIIISGSDVGRNEQWLIIEYRSKIKNSNAELRLLTLNEFIKPSLQLRRVLYDQGSVLLHHLKLPGTSYVESRMSPDVIVNNALFLYEVSRSSDIDKTCLKVLIGDHYERFSYICSTTESKNWTRLHDLHNLHQQPLSNNTPIVPVQSSSENQTTQLDLHNPNHQLLSNSASLVSMQSSSLPEQERMLDTTPDGKKKIAGKDSSDSYYRWSHKVNIQDLKRGDHVYAWRYGCVYQHHGIVIAKKDIPEERYCTHSIPNIEDLMIVENNRTEAPCIRIVTIAQFAHDYCIRRVQYGKNRKRDIFLLDIKLRGKCHFDDSLAPDEIVNNALFLYRCSGLLDRFLTKISNSFLIPATQNDTAAKQTNFVMSKYNLVDRNCEHFAFACSTDQTLIQRCSTENSQPAGQSQQVLAGWNFFMQGIVRNTMWHGLEKGAPWHDEVLPSTRLYSRQILTTIRTGVSCQQCYMNFLRVAAPVAGLTAAICCLVEVLPLLVRHLIYRCTKGIKRMTFIARGLAIKAWQCIKGIAHAIFSNGLAAIFSLAGGALGMLIPIPVVNIIVSGLLSTIGFLLGRYLSGLPSNIYRYYQYRKRKPRAAIQYQTLENADDQANL